MFDGDYRSWYRGEKKLSEFFGDMRDGVPNGRGLRIYASGFQYVGRFNKGVEETASATDHAYLTWPDGTTYSGTFARGKPHGRGEKKRPDGTVYRGEFALGREHGLGKTVYGDGTTFEGRFRFGARDGPGILTDEDGIQEKGVFKEDQNAADVSEDFAGSQEAESADVDDPDALQPLSLTSICHQTLARIVTDRVDLYPASLLQRCVPEHHKPPVARAFVEHAKNLSVYFREFVPKIAWASIRTIQLASCPLKPADVQMLFYFLESNSVIDSLLLQANGLYPTAIKQLADVIVQSPTLTSVNLSCVKRAAATARTQATTHLALSQVQPRREARPRRPRQRHHQRRQANAPQRPRPVRVRPRRRVRLELGPRHPSQVGAQGPRSEL